MSERDDQASFDVIGTQPESQFEVRTLPQGSLLELTDGRFATLYDNPHDGVWLICEMVDETEQPLGITEPVMCYDVIRLIRTGAKDV